MHTELSTLPHQRQTVLTDLQKQRDVELLDTSKRINRQISDSRKQVDKGQRLLTSDLCEDHHATLASTKQVCFSRRDHMPRRGKNSVRVSSERIKRLN